MFTLVGHIGDYHQQLRETANPETWFMQEGRLEFIQAKTITLLPKP